MRVPKEGGVLFQREKGKFSKKNLKNAEKQRRGGGGPKNEKKGGGGGSTGKGGTWMKGPATCLCEGMPEPGSEGNCGKEERK